MMRSWLNTSPVISRCWSNQSSVLPTDQNTLKPFNKIPSPPAWPLLGHLPLLAREENKTRVDRFWRKIYQQYGDIVRIKLPWKNILFLFNPEDHKVMHRNEPRIPYMPEFDMFSYVREEKLKEVFSSPSLITNSETWYEVRQAVQQDMLRPSSANYYIPHIETVAENFVQAVRSARDHQGKLDITVKSKQFGLDAVAVIFLGSDIGSLKGSEEGKALADDMSIMLSYAADIMHLPKWALEYHPNFKKMSNIIEMNHKRVKSIMDREINNALKDEDTILSKLVKSSNGDLGFTTLFAIDAIQAGMDTTGNNAIFLFYNLARNQEKQETLYREICDTIGPEGKLTESSLAKEGLRYTKACQMESIRLNNAAFGSSRIIDRDVVIGGYQVPKGTHLVRCGATTMKDSKHFTNPESFIPERWLRNHQDRHTADPFAYLPFGHGSRSCIGQRFAKLELNVLMVKVIQKFRIEYDGEDVGIKTSFVAAPDKPVVLKFIDREIN